MDFNPIFGSGTNPDCDIWTVTYKGCKKNCFAMFWEQLNDTEYITDFVLERKNQLFHWGTTIDGAITLIRNEMKSLRAELLKTAYKGPGADLSAFFMPLHKKEHFLDKKRMFHKKAWVPHPKSSPILRLYGLELLDKTVIITGGGIKLYKYMDEDETLKEELKKINNVQAYIDYHRIIDRFGLV